MYIHNLNPILINLELFEIRWYSLAYIVGILAGWYFGKRVLYFKNKQESVSFKPDDFDDLISHIIISIIIGGRLGYVLFYNLEYFLDNFIDVFKIWEGGMSFHGGLIGVIIGTYFFAKKKNIKIFLILDIISYVAPIGLFFGRVANFINSELVGIPSNIYWSVVFPLYDSLPRHPSQIYEALLEGLILFVVLHILIYNKKVLTGICSSIFLILYGIFRIFAEQFREPDIQIGYLFKSISIGSVLSFVMIVIGIFILTVVSRHESN